MIIYLFLFAVKELMNLTSKNILQCSAVHFKATILQKKAHSGYIIEYGVISVM